MLQLALLAIGRDRPGIVAAVSEVLLEHQGNVEDSQMAILRGHFAMTLVVSAPAATDLAALRKGLERVRERLGLEALAVSEIEHIDTGEDAAASHIVSVYGVDHPGILHAVASTLAGKRVGITDLTTRVLGERGEAPLYTMILEVALPPGCDAAALEQALSGVCAEQQVDFSFRELERDAL
jgi:glycine cleavage system transcriptional repressor